MRPSCGLQPKHRGFVRSCRALVCGSGMPCPLRQHVNHVEAKTTGATSSCSGDHGSSGSCRHTRARTLVVNSKDGRGPSANSMSDADTDRVFSGSISKLYETYLVPLIFEPYAADLANRLASRSLSRVLEIAAGTGVATRALAFALPSSVSIVATDLNQAMLDQASVVGTRRHVEWRQADAMQLPFADGAFDAVVCQFGVMFFPDKSRAFSEARRVLRPGGVFIFNVWDRIEENEFADTVTTALESLFPADPPRFLFRVPHGYYERPTIERDLANGGFMKSAQIATVAARSRAASSRVPAIAYCQGTPLRNEIEARDATRLGESTDVAAEAIAERFGRGAVDGKIQAHVVTIAN
jgi:SAM-dependent methyltransferase